MSEVGWKKYQVRRVCWDDPEEIAFEALIEIDDLGGPVMSWNGFLCPLLGTGEVQRLIDWQATAGPDYDTLEWQMDEELTVLVVNANKEEDGASIEDRLEPQMIAGSAFWMPGAFSWTWSFADEVNE